MRTRISSIFHSRVAWFFLGILAAITLQLASFWFNYFFDPEPILAKGIGGEFREVKEIIPLTRRYFYSLEFPGSSEEFHAFVKRIKFPGKMDSPTHYSYVTPDSDNQISVSYEEGKILYVFER